jgi:hypothetical protein
MSYAPSGSNRNIYIYIVRNYVPLYFIEYPPCLKMFEINVVDLNGIYTYIRHCIAWDHNESVLRNSIKIDLSFMWSTRCETILNFPAFYIMDSSKTKRNPPHGLGDERQSRTIGRAGDQIGSRHNPILSTHSIQWKETRSTTNWTLYYSRRQRR